ncbi:class I SAM-dependent methyltransferase [Cohnella fermenti]|uniref:Methyltransferase domain-containing protein n=1 Tax=Cohnella fermenti TaxID=2565925 RepID=A0A4S4BQB1_9BACL|nr:class I SAM-dependent methyltransferase [Cohnella fermenti]THF76950.1 methyltransferase domain-containing protein [Cohnella fermenti]
MIEAGEIGKLLNPRPGERILDLGCGNGDLTAWIAAAGADVMGIDSSEEAIARARMRHEHLRFEVADARSYRAASPFDGVFSHAVLHWIPEPEQAVAAVWQALRAGGRFVAEFAAEGNVATVTDAIERALREHGYAGEGWNPWYLPSIGQHASLLEKIGFRVAFAQHIDAPTPVKHELGLRHWLNGFSRIFGAEVAPEHLESIFASVEAETEPKLKRDGRWTMDTARLRIVAFKPGE